MADSSGRTTANLFTHTQDSYRNAKKVFEESLQKFNQCIDDANKLTNQGSAAAFLDILRRLDTNRVVHALDPVLQDMSNIVHCKFSQPFFQKSANQAKDEIMEKVLEWLSPSDMSKMHQDIKGKRTDNTGTWFLDSEEFTRWANGEGSTLLFCPGKGSYLFIVLISFTAGAGKSVLT